MEMPSRSIYRMFQIDTNRINARQKLNSMNLLERWADNGVISIDLCEVALIEASAGKSKSRKQKAESHIYSFSEITSPKELEMIAQIEKIVFPNGAKL